VKNGWDFAKKRMLFVGLEKQRQVNKSINIAKLYNTRTNSASK